MRRFRKADKSQGQSLVEFALVLPLFLLLMFGLIDFSRLLFTYVSLSNATREMARAAAVSTNWPDATTGSATAMTAFNNYAMFAGGRNDPSDAVVVLSGTSACARTRDTGGTCATGLTTNPTCAMSAGGDALQGCSFAIPPNRGFVEVQTTYIFQFNPLFQNNVEGVVDVWFMRPVSTITTTARAYVE